MSLRIYGNRSLKTLPGQLTRPTPSRVRAALFNIWQGSIAGCRWLDLCTGSGALGAEALCRQAAVVVGIEQSGPACAVIQQNWQQVAQPEQSYKIIRGDVLQRLPSLAGQSFDRIYFDPPYASGLYESVLTAIDRHSLLALEGELAAEHDPNCTLPEAIGSLERCRQKVYGNTALSFYCRYSSSLPSPPMPPSTSAFFAFESDFVDTLRCIPMQVRFKLDTCGVKLKLPHWNQFNAAERQHLVDAPCTTAAEIQAYRSLLHQLVLSHNDEPPADLPIDPDPDWHNVTAIPESIQQKATELEVAIELNQWVNLSPIQRFALIKLSRSSHENRNFLPALQEFHLV